MAELGQTLTNKVGPLPTWAWAGLGTAGLAGYMVWRKKQSVNAQQAAAAANSDSSNLGNVPISNLVTAAEPMPVSSGPTFVSVTNNVPNTNPAANGTAPAPTSGKGSASARAAYDNALTAYGSAKTSGANISVLQKLQNLVDTTQAIYTGSVGTTAARTKYDNALAAYGAAKKAGNTKALPALQQQVNNAQSAYTGKTVG